MKSIISNIAIAVLAFFAGYLAYPSLNKVKAPEKYEPSALTQKQNTHQAIGHTPDKVANKSRVTEPADVTKLTKATESDVNAEQKTDPIALIDDIPVNTAAESATKEQKDELIQWAAQHKADLNELITTHVPGHIAENMFNKIAENNDFLAEPKMKQAPELDANWAYNTEQELTNYINNHSEAKHFDLISVSCKQLKCDVLGIEKEAQAWLKIFFSMFKNIPSVNPPDSSGDTKSLSYLNGDETSSIYYQLKFTPR